jgi:hypothetical protein
MKNARVTRFVTFIQGIHVAQASAEADAKGYLLVKAQERDHGCWVAPARKQVTWWRAWRAVGEYTEREAE